VSLSLPVWVHPLKQKVLSAAWGMHKPIRRCKGSARCGWVHCFLWQDAVHVSSRNHMCWTQCPCREKAQRTSNASFFLGLISALRIQPTWIHSPTMAPSRQAVTALLQRTHDRGTARGSDGDPQLLLTPFNMKSCKLSWWKLISNQPQLPKSEANSRQRNGNGLSQPRARGRLVCAVQNSAKAGTASHCCKTATGAPLSGDSMQDSCAVLWGTLGTDNPL